MKRCIAVSSALSLSALFSRWNRTFSSIHDAWYGLPRTNQECRLVRLVGAVRAIPTRGSRLQALELRGELLGECGYILRYTRHQNPRGWKER